jgi:peptide deformylase
MAILKVAHMGNPILRQIAEAVPVDEIGTPAFQQLCDDLLESMYEHDGAGLAAPQVHVSRRVVVIVLDDEDGPMFLVNPRITPLTTETATAYEGCLSLPNMRGRVARPDRIRVDAYDRDGTKHAFEAAGWAARVVQHECDHLDGVLYIDRADPKSMAFLPEFRRYGPPLPSDDDESEEDDGEDGDE